MARNAYCNECATRVLLTEQGECVFGHPRSALRDVRDGELSAPAVPDSGRPAVAASHPRPQKAGAPNLTRSQATVAAVVGRLIVIVPAVAVIALGLWTGYVMGVGMGQSKLEAWLWSIASMATTGVVLAMIVWNRRRKMNR